MSSIVTLKLDAASQEKFNALRRKHVPPERNYLEAHLTLFHTLPEEITETPQSIADETAGFSFTLDSLRSIGKGVAAFGTSPELQGLHKQLTKAFVDHLTAQNRQPLRPHIAIQNKVEPATAKATLTELSATWQPHLVHAQCLALWRYLNGPWQHLRDFAFSSR